MLDLIIFILALVIDISWIVDFAFGLSLAIPLGIAMLIKNRNEKSVVFIALALGLIMELLLSVQVGVIMIGFIFTLLIMKILSSFIVLSNFNWSSWENWLSSYIFILIMLVGFHSLVGFVNNYISYGMVVMPNISIWILGEAILGVIWLGLIRKKIND